MSKHVDLTKPLSDEDRAYLKSRSRWFDIEENDRIFKDGSAESGEPTSSPDSPAMAPKNLAEESGQPTDAPEQSDDDGEIDIAALTVEDLKEELRKLNLSTGGNKDELASRLIEALEEE